MKKDEKAQTATKAATKKNASKTKKPDTKKSSAKAPAKDSTNKKSAKGFNEKNANLKETDENKNPVDFQTFPPIRLETVLSVAKESNTIVTVSTETAIKDLVGKYTEAQVTKMLEGEKDFLASEETIYSTDRDKLANLIADKGWNDPTSQPKMDEAEQVEPHYEIDDQAAEFHDSRLEDLPEIDITKEETSGEESSEPALDIKDPNQEIYDFFSNNPTFQAELNKKEVALMRDMIAGKKVQASFSKTDKGLFENIVSKFESYTPADDQEDLNEFRREGTPSRELAKPEPKAEIEPEEDKPMTAEEKAEYETENERVRLAKTNYDNAPLVMMESISIIRNKRLYREKFATIGDWAKEEHGLTPQYLLNMAQSGDFLAVLGHISPEVKKLAGSVNSVQKWAQSTNKIAEHLGIPKSDFETMSPVIEAVAQSITEFGTDENGKENSIAPRIFAAANEKAIEIIETGTIEFAGEQMAIKDVIALGPEIVTKAAKGQILETVGEQIKAQTDVIVDYIKEKQERRTKPHEGVKPPKANGREEFVGVVLGFDLICKHHPDFENNTITPINAGCKFACSCVYQLLEGYEGLQLIEIDGKFVSYK